MNIEAFHKLKDYEEREKDKKQQKYLSSIEYFEAKATELYHLLKEKESLEAEVEKELANQTVNIYSIQYYQHKVNMVEKSIADLQPEVQQARQNMYRLEDKRDQAYVEVKKYEKIIDRKRQEYKAWMNYEEAKQMDDISIQQFSNKADR